MHSAPSHSLSLLCSQYPHYRESQVNLLRDSWLNPCTSCPDTQRCCARSCGICVTFSAHSLHFDFTVCLWLMGKLGLTGWDTTLGYSAGYSANVFWGIGFFITSVQHYSLNETCSKSQCALWIQNHHGSLSSRDEWDNFVLGIKHT